VESCRPSGTLWLSCEGGGCSRKVDDLGRYHRAEQPRLFAAEGRATTGCALGVCFRFGGVWVRTRRGCGWRGGEWLGVKANVLGSGGRTVG